MELNERIFHFKKDHIIESGLIHDTKLAIYNLL